MNYFIYTSQSRNSNPCFERIAATPRLLRLLIRRKRLRSRLCGNCHTYKTLCAVLEFQRNFSSKCSMFHGINYKESLYFIRAHRNGGRGIALLGVGGQHGLDCYSDHQLCHCVLVVQCSTLRPCLPSARCLSVFHSHCYELNPFGSCVCLAFFGDPKRAEFTKPRPRLFKRCTVIFRELL